MQQKMSKYFGLMQDPAEAPGCSHCSGPALAIVANWKVKQWKENPVTFGNVTPFPSEVERTVIQVVNQDRRT